MMFICCHTFIDEAAAAQHVSLELRVADEGKAHSHRLISVSYLVR